MVSALSQLNRRGMFLLLNETRDYRFEEVEKLFVPMGKIL